MTPENHDHQKTADAFHRRLVEGMAANVRPRDVENGNTIVVLMRHGYRAADIAECLDEVEALVTGRERDPVRGGALIAAAVLLVVPCLLGAAPAQASILDARIGEWPTLVAIGAIAWLSAILGLVLGGLLLGRLRRARAASSPLISRGPCRFYLGEDRLVCLTCDAASAPGTYAIPSCSLGGGA